MIIHIGRTFGYTAISSETREPDKLKKAIEFEIDLKKKDGLSKKSFERIRKKLVGRYLSSFKFNSIYSKFIYELLYEGNRIV